MKLSCHIGSLLKYILIAISFITLTGFSFSLPSVSDGRKLIEAEIQIRSNGLIKLVSFAKTNGVESEVNGVKIYQMDFTAEVEFTDDCMVSREQRFRTVRGQPSGELDSFNPRFAGMRKAAKGQRMSVTDKFVFTKTEKGWLTGNETNLDQHIFLSAIKNSKTLLVVHFISKEDLPTLDTVISKKLSQFKSSISVKKVDGATVKLKAVSPSLNGAAIYMRVSADRDGSSSVSWKCRTENTNLSLCQGLDAF